jgi:hypothetical protein
MTDKSEDLIFEDDIETNVIVERPPEHEQRKSQRRLTRWNFSGYCKNKKTFNGKLENISVNGALINVYGHPQCIQTDERVFLDIHVYYSGKKRNIKVVGILKHVSFAENCKRAGVEFLVISEQDRNWLSKFCNGVI